VFTCEIQLAAPKLNRADTPGPKLKDPALQNRRTEHPVRSWAQPLFSWCWLSIKLRHHAVSPLSGCVAGGPDFCRWRNG